ncbi:MAG TPA: bifunctional hexulose-6-phosphate synthase/ribonuclease regulator, partial [Thermoplasmatales archaeon]|nr:bifunctional hexulose-6-phosphate synthase/ribonuclease regulator [Thermoplasmatales archaeon]
MKVVLQVALDLLNAHRALKIAEEAVNGGADWLEAGTPLIKSEG